MTTVRVVKAHQVPARAPIRVAAGQRVRVGERDTTWPAFVLVSTEDGSGWVPTRHIDRTAEQPVMLASYDTTELATTAGQVLAVLESDDPSGWTWVANSTGRQGWVPNDTIEPLP
jgi:hypothetical protein